MERYNCNDIIKLSGIEANKIVDTIESKNVQIDELIQELDRYKINLKISNIQSNHKTYLKKIEVLEEELKNRPVDSKVSYDIDKYKRESIRARLAEERMTNAYIKMKEENERLKKELELIKYSKKDINTSKETIITKIEKICIWA